MKDKTYEKAYNDIESLLNIKVVNCFSIIFTTKIDSFVENNQNETTSSNYPPKSMFISPTIKETQSSTPWCAAYVTAFIVSYKTNTPYYAREVAAFAGSSPSQSISRGKCVDFAKSKGLSKTRQTIFDVSDKGMMDQISSYCPVCVGAYRKGSLTSSHAFAVCGFSWSGSSINNWYLWNPWHNYMEYIGSNRIYISPQGTEFKKWENFIVDMRS